MRRDYMLSIRVHGTVLAMLCWVPLVLAQQAEPPKEVSEPASLVIEPEMLVLEVGDTRKLEVSVLDTEGGAVEAEILFFSLARRSVTIDKAGKVTAHAPGNFRVSVGVRRKDKSLLRKNVSVKVSYPPLQEMGFVGLRNEMYQGTSVELKVHVTDASGAVRNDEVVQFSVSDSKLARILSPGVLKVEGVGDVNVIAQAGGIKTEETVQIIPNPVQSIELIVDQTVARTGDVLHFTARGKDALGRQVNYLPISFSVSFQPTEHPAPGASGQIDNQGRFVAELPGRYTVVASSGGMSERQTVEIRARNVGRKLELVGHAPVRDKHTSDLWVWEGVDGRDYAVTGTWSADGEAYFWDVTDPANMKQIGSYKVDARTVNDVKVSADGRICVISREGASNRRNGLVILDVSNPAEVKELSAFDEGLTGGVHNVFIYQDHVYAINNSRRYDVIDISDPAVPNRVGQFELDTPGHSVHDVWVVDGIAYSSNWHDGVQLVDVGNGIAGGSPSNPVKIDSYAYPNGWNHAAFPYFSESTGKFFVIAGDEAFPNGFGVGSKKPTIPAGWLHFIDFSNPGNPEEVARFEIPGAGTHNIWIEDDTLYVGYYNAGLRVIDISGELMGDLYRQGREIAWYLPFDPDGFIANAPMTWGPQPHKGVIFLSDHSSGLWAVRFADQEK